MVLSSQDNMIHRDRADALSPPLCRIDHVETVGQPDPHEPPELGARAHNDTPVRGVDANPGLEETRSLDQKRELDRRRAIKPDVQKQSDRLGLTSHAGLHQICDTHPRYTAFKLAER